MVLRESIGKSPLFSCYQVHQEDAHQLRLISSYGGYRECERGSNSTPMEQHNDERRISHQASKRNDAIHGRLPHQMIDPFILLVPPVYQALHEVVPGDRRMAWPTGGERAHS
ncbi:hypothetical protein [Absidia glauca]|uniref:Ndc10 domain-containing protein n=1 Tax=Absidia glauca TaxID=4829 RepID=A0A163K7M5_ABSGL|nr:hypothetical protein [Absidia glauca]